MNLVRNYEATIILTDVFNDSELKNWVFNFAKRLKKFNICNISVISRGKQRLIYKIKDKVKGSYIQLNFNSIPKYINIIDKKLKTDNNVIRFLILKKN